MKNAGAGDLPISLFMPTSRASTSVNKTGTWSFMQPTYREKTAPCSAACPCGQDIPRIEMLVSRGKIEEAWRTLLSENPLPGVCGRVCFHPCEGSCNRREADEAVSINALERFIDDAAVRGAFREESIEPKMSGKRVAVIGSGPAGLSAAYFLGRLGYRCDILEAASAPGGVLRTGIPAYRLPNEVLERELKRVEASGARISCSHPIDKDFFQAARKEYDAVFVACGNGSPTPLEIPGAGLAADGLAFLNKTKNGSMGGAAGTAEKAQRAGSAETALVIGGGNSAVDVARSLLRLGVEATIVYRRRLQDMPAFGEEIERATAEGVRVIDLSSPLSIEKGKAGLSLRVQKMSPSTPGSDGRMRVEPIAGEIESITADAVYTAIGAGVAESWMESPDEGALQHMGHCAAHWVSPAGIPILYGGDTVNQEESVADALASGKQAAIALDVFFREGSAAVEREMERCRVGDGGSVSMEIYLHGPRAARSNRVVRFSDLNADYFSPSKRKVGEALAPGATRLSFVEAAAALDEAEAARQAERCFNCGICNDCDNCRTFCPEAAVIARRSGRTGWEAEARVDRVVDKDYCKGCGICVTECPRSAMVIEEQQS
jgi:NADPH-dependent glutamate synthase beta subunit-like oxidoreductase